MTSNLVAAAQQLVERLSASKKRIVLAESCTGGLVSAELARIPGVSEWLCGSAVTYRCDTKVRWLGVRSADIEQHSAVSREVAEQMALGVLNKTPEASLSAAITGHLGPDAPAAYDGVVYIGIANRSVPAFGVDVTRHQLVTSQRLQRQEEAACLVMQLAFQAIAEL